MDKAGDDSDAKHNIKLLVISTSKANKYDSERCKVLKSQWHCSVGS